MFVRVGNISLVFNPSTWASCDIFLRELTQQTNKSTCSKLTMKILEKCEIYSELAIKTLERRY